MQYKKQKENIMYYKEKIAQTLNNSTLQFRQHTFPVSCIIIFVTPKLYVSE